MHPKVIKRQSGKQSPNDIVHAVDSYVHDSLHGHRLVLGQLGQRAALSHVSEGVHVVLSVDSLLEEYEVDQDIDYLVGEEDQTRPEEMLEIGVRLSLRVDEFESFFWSGGIPVDVPHGLERDYMDEEAGKSVDVVEDQGVLEGHDSEGHDASWVGVYTDIEEFGLREDKDEDVEYHVAHVAEVSEEIVVSSHPVVDEFVREENDRKGQIPVE